MKQENKFKKIAKIVAFITVIIIFSFTALAQDYDVISDGQRWYVCDAHEGYVGSGVKIKDGALVGPNITEGIGTNVQTSIKNQEGGTVSPDTNIGGKYGGSVAIVDMDAFFDEMGIGGLESNYGIGSFDGLNNQYSKSNYTVDEYKAVGYRFLCYKEGTESPFAECCGLVLQCFNDDGKKIRRTGNVQSVIEEYPCDSPYDFNCVLKIGIEQEIFESILYKKYTFELKNTASSIFDWSHYDYLEFYINFVRDHHLKLMILNTDSIPGAAFPSGYSDYILFNENITKYVVNDFALTKWLHVKIPLYELDEDITNVRMLTFYEAVDNLPVSDTWLTDPQIGDPNLATGKFRNIIGLDRIFLSRDDQPRYCSAGQYPTWIDDLDDPAEDSFDVAKGELPCISTPGYGWTGTRCCGDDQTHTNNETYIDTEHGCWRGLPVYNNTAVDIGSNLLYLNEQFHACDLPDEEWDMVVGQLGEENVTQELPGTLMGDWFCNFNHTWKHTALFDSSFARTKALALQLLNFSEGLSEYTLFCDSYENALNEYNYFIGDEDSTLNYLEDNVNNICVLKYKEDGLQKVAVGTSINNKIDDADSFLVLLNKDPDYCTYLDEGSGGPFYRCSAEDNTVWYNPKTKSIIFDKYGVDLQPKKPNFIYRILALIRSVFGLGEEDEATDMIQTTAEFDRIYVNRVSNPDKQIAGIMGGDFIQVSYKGLESANISYAVSKPRNEVSDQPYFSSTFDGEVFVVSINPSLPPTYHAEAFDYWQSLTARIRLK